MSRQHNKQQQQQHLFAHRHRHTRSSTLACFPTIRGRVQKLFRLLLLLWWVTGAGQRVVSVHRVVWLGASCGRPCPQRSSPNLRAGATANTTTCILHVVARFGSACCSLLVAIRIVHTLVASWSKSSSQVSVLNCVFFFSSAST